MISERLCHDIKSIMKGLTEHISEQFWTKVLKPIFDKLDRWDLIVVFLLWFIGYLGWLQRANFSFQERLLWGSCLLIIGTLWFVVRKNIWGKPWKTGDVSLQVSLTWLFLVLLLTGAWGYSAFQIYKLPSFTEKAIGVYIARFEGDPGHTNQHDLYNDITSEIKWWLPGREDLVEVKKLSRKVDDVTAAKRLGKKGGATFVVWGKMLGNAEMQAWLTVVGGKGVYDPKVPVLGDLENIKLPKKKTKTLQTVLAFFFIGYNFYHSKEYDDALHHFREAKKKLEEFEIDEKRMTPVKATLASIHFYVGNIYYLQDDVELAKVEYEKAIGKTSDPMYGEEKPCFLYPINNLGAILIKENNIDKAKKYLKRAFSMCSEENNSLICSYINYNLGDVHLEEIKYEDAIKYFDKAINYHQNLGSANEEDDMDFRFLAFAMQNKAYAYIKLAESEDTDKSGEYYREAKQLWDESVQKMKHDKVNILPTSFKRNRGRIYIGLKKWSSAIEVLEEAKEAEPHYPDVYLLLATSYWFIGEKSKSSENLETFIKKRMQQSPSRVREGLEYFEKITAEPY